MLRDLIIFGDLSWSGLSSIFVQSLLHGNQEHMRWRCPASIPGSLAKLVQGASIKSGGDISAGLVR